MNEITTLRCRPINIIDNQILFESLLETNKFKLKVNEKDLEKLKLYKEYDIEIEIVRDDAGRIIEGKALEIHPIMDVLDPWLEWMKWYREITKST